MTPAPHRTMGIAPLLAWIDYASSTNSNKNTAVGLEMFIEAVEANETEAEAKVFVEQNNLD